MSSLQQKTRRAHLDQRLWRARRFIDTNFARNPALDDIAAHAFLSAAHFLRQFKLAFGVTPHQYLTERKLEHARDLLIHTRQPITDIVFASGFGNCSAFSRLFPQAGWLLAARIPAARHADATVGAAALRCRTLSAQIVASA